MVGFNRRFAPMLVADEVTVRPGELELGHPLPGQRGAAGGRQLVRQRRAGRVAVHRGRRSLHRHAELVGGSLPEEVYAVKGPEKDDVQVTVRFANGSSGVITYVTAGNPRFPKETLDAAAGGRSARLDNFRKATVWTGRDQKRHAVARRPGQGPASRARRSSSRPARTGAADAHPGRVPGGRHQGDDSGAREPAERASGAGVSATPEPGITRRGSRHPGSAGTRAGWPGCPRPRWRGARATRLLRAAWSPRQVTQDRLGLAAPPPAAGRRFTAVLPPDTAARVPGEARAAVLDSADRLLRGDWEVLGVTRTDLVHPDWFCDPVTDAGRLPTVMPSGSITGRRSRRGT